MRARLPFLFLAGALLATPPLLPDARAGDSLEMGGGAVFFDYDNDGWLDLFHVLPNGTMHLHRNDRGRFVDRSDLLPSGGAFRTSYGGMGVAAADYDNDGFTDLFVTGRGVSPHQSTSGVNSLLRNNGGLSFTDVAKFAGVSGTDTTWSASAAWFDYDRDGWLDLMVVNYFGIGPSYQWEQSDFLYRNRGDGTFEEVAAAKGVDRVPEVTETRSNAGLGVATADVDNDGWPDIYVANDFGDDVLYRNNGDGTFTDVSGPAGIREGHLGGGWSMGVDFADWDEDGDLDLIVTEFFQDFFARNDGDGTFTDVAEEVGFVENLNGWGVAFIDFDNDGDLDVYNTNGYLVNTRGQVEEEPNAYWVNVGGSFTETAVTAGLAEPGKGRAAAFADYDRDGYIDIFIVNNNEIFNPTDSPEYILYHNDGGGSFRVATVDAGLAPAGAGAARAAGSPAGRTVPGAAHHWIGFRVRGGLGLFNRSGIGARVTVAAGGRSRMQEMTGGTSYCSSRNGEFHFGLGSVASVDSVVVVWPGAGRRVIRNPEIDRVHDVVLAPTPVTLLSFTARAVGSGIEIAWSVADGIGAAGFLLERRRLPEGERARLDTGLLRVEAGRGSFLDTAVEPGASYEYRLVEISRTGEETVHGPVSGTAAPRADAAAPSRAYPNPFRAGASVRFALPAPGAPTLEVFDLAGRLVDRRAAPPAAAGPGEIFWPGTSLSGAPAPSGTYFYRVRLDGRIVAASRMTLAR